MKYTIDYGFGEATLYTPYDGKERFYTLAGTCFGIRKSIMHCVILRAEEIPCEDFERLEFNGDVYVWREDGARKMIAPLWAADKEWNMDYCEEVRYKPTEHIRELLRAEKDGRLVVPPCKIGATVYRFQRYFNDATLKSEIKIKPCVVESVSTKCIITTDHVVMLFSDFGKTVFLTREEAEKALKGNAERTEEQ